MNRKIRFTETQIAVLKVVAVVGLLGVALVAPNALQLLKFTGSEKKRKSKLNTLNISRNRLIKKGLLKYSSDGFIELTKEGKKVLRQIELINYKIKPPKKWDKKWRVLIFDIPEKKRRDRDQLRITLNSIGFIRLQNSVWVYPYDCEDFITLLKADFSFGKQVLYMVVERIENESRLLRYFNLLK